MKLMMHSFDFEECTLTFSVPKEIMHNNSFGNVPGGVEVDMVAITKDAALGVVSQNSTSDNTSSPKSLCMTCRFSESCGARDMIQTIILLCKGYEQA